MTHPYRRARPFRPTLPEASISELGNIRSLHLGTPTIQSSMNLAQPHELVLSYSRVMMAWLLFCDKLPQNIIQIGLGGGSFARWLHHYFPQCEQIAVEINPQVIQIARAAFALDFEGEHFQIVEADGAHYIQILNKNNDLILVDGFDGVQIIDELVAEPFFHNCAHALTENGIFVTNWWSGDKRYSQFLTRLRHAFNNRVLEIPAETHGNIAVFAFQAACKWNFSQLSQRARMLSDEYGLDFVRMLSDAKARNHHNGHTFQFDSTLKKVL